MSHLILPKDLPVPKDDGECDHLAGSSIASVALPTCSNSSIKVDLSALDGLTLVFCYPRSGAPGETVPPEWDAMPGARGCTPQACSYRDNLAQLKQHGVKHVFGLSTQDSAYQKELQDRLHLPYELLSDEELEFQRALKLPTHEWQGKQLVKRLTLAVEAGVIKHVWYPVFPSDSNVHEVLKWLRQK